MVDEKIKATIGIRVDGKVDVHGRLYPEDVLKKAVEEFNAGGGWAMFMGKGDRRGSVKAIAGTADLSLNDDGLEVEIGLLGCEEKGLTKNAQLLKTMFEAGTVSFGLSGTRSKDEVNIRAVSIEGEE